MIKKYRMIKVFCMDENCDGNQSWSEVVFVPEHLDEANRICFYCKRKGFLIIREKE